MGRTFQVPRKRPACEVDGAHSKLKRCCEPVEQASRAPVARTVAPQGRKPLAVVQQSAGVTNQPQPTSKRGEAGFQALYTASSNKRRNNKTWLDGFILFQGDSAPYTLHLFSSEGKLVTKSPYKTEIAVEDLLQVRSWDIEVCDAVSPVSIHNGSCYIDAAAEAALPPARLPLPAKLPARSAPTSRPQQRKPQAFNLEGALILEEASEGRSLAFVPEFLARKLRPHQERGVKFLYNAVSGKNAVSEDGADAERGSSFGEDHSQRAHYGAILADDMGLGKTLQVLATSWALMNSHGPTGRPIVRKMLIVSPSSVCNNWAKEIKKWLGPFQGECHRVLMPGKGATNLVNGFKAGIQWKYLIASYENVRKVSSDLKGCIDLLICDEGHRLKAKNLNSTMKALLELGCPRRVILTGTPCQNNLLEFYSMMSFVNPGLLGPPAVFQRVFVKPIEASQDTSATPEEIEVGQSRSKELQRRIACFMLRRTAAVNEKYLPKCFQYVVFCRPSATQLSAYKEELHGGEECGSRSERSALNRVFNGSGIDGTKVLSIINRLRQICNHAQFCQVKRGMTTAQGSTKLNVLRCMLAAATRLGEKVVIVSTSTQMLDAAAQVCGGLGLPTGRIDGSTAAAVRQELVDQFNDTSPAMGSLIKVFLLSTRAGGAGLNLIGGSRLVLLDSDWNPAMDQQAMARIWRDGQKRPCHIYRLLVTGLIDEKIFQRQLFKGNLSGVVGNVSTEAGSSKTSKKSNNAGSFSREELRKLFSINEDTDCDTQATMATGDAAGKMVWNDVKDTTDDQVLREAVQGASVSFAWLQAVKGQAGDNDGAQDLDDSTENEAPCSIKGSSVEQPLSLDDTEAVQDASAEQCMSDDDFLVEDAEVCVEGTGIAEDECNGRVQHVLDDSDSEKDGSGENEMHALSSALEIADSDLLDDIQLDSPLVSQKSGRLCKNE